MYRLIEDKILETEVTALTPDDQTELYAELKTMRKIETEEYDR